MLSVAEKNFGEKMLPAGGAAAVAARPSLPCTSLGDQLCPDVDDSTRWSGLRPMSPDGLPVVGAAGFVGDAPVFVNSGHGALGWTLSAGSAEVLAEVVSTSLQTNTEASHVDAAARKQLSSFASHLTPSRFRWPEVLQRARRMYFGGNTAQATPATTS